MGLLRLKILTAGALFLLLSIFPIALAKSIFSHNQDLNPEQRFSRAILASLSYLAACTVSAVILDPLYDYKPATMPVQTSRWAVLMGVVAALGALSAFGWLMSFGWAHY